MGSLSKMVLCLGFLFLSFSGMSQQKAETVKNHIKSHLSEYGITEIDIDESIVSNEYTSRHNGVTHVYLLQTIGGIEVFNGVMNANISAEGEVLSVGNRFSPKARYMINATAPSLTPQQAIGVCADHLGLELTSIPQVTEPLLGEAMKGKLSDGGISLEDIRVKLVYFELAPNDVRLCWDIVIKEISGVDWWEMRIDAISGEFLAKNNWMSTCSFGANPNHIHSTNCSSKTLNTPAYAPLLANSYEVFAIPVEAPTFGSRTTETAPWINNPAASPFGWHDTDGASGAEYTITRGNNVYAQEDQNGDDGTGYSPDGGASLDFIFPLVLEDDPLNYEDAAITNLFYMNNIMHDVLYNYGFDEESGNFQENNYGAPGLGNDFVFADAQDGGGTNNANFGTPPDGENPRMQMFLWNVAPPSFITIDGIDYSMVPAAFGPDEGNWSGEVVLVDDGSANPTEACSAILNDVSGKIALIDRGSCNFTTKVANAEAAGAIAVIVCQNSADAPFVMSGAGAFGIPSVMISQADCNAVKDALNSGTVTADLTLTQNFDRDGDYDNGIIAHEYGHGVSNRLTGGPSIITCLISLEQMGEGWSDYLGLITTLEAGDDGTDARGIGTFALGQETSGNGIRTYPYSTDFGINPHTYSDIAVESIPHGVGSVWCAMLWDMTWALIDEYGFDPDIYEGTGGNNIALQLVMDGMKLQPCSPGFVDGRDAILLADQINNGGANQCLIWEVFAARGLGYGASQGSVWNNADGIESFELAPTCTISIDKEGPAEVAAGSNATYTLTIQNNSASDATGVVVTDNIPSGATYIDGSASCAASFSDPILTIDLGTLIPGEIITCTYEVNVPSTPVSEIVFEDDAESGLGNFNIVSDIGPFVWEQTSAQAFSPSNSFFATNADIQSDMFMILEDVGPIDAADVLSFWHWYNTEELWDGGVLEISTDNGVNWLDLGFNITQNGYNLPIFTNPGSPISGRLSFTGNSLGFIQTIVDMSPYAGLTVDIRWRMASDEFVAGQGWYVDDIRLTNGLADFTNQACLSSNEWPTYCDEVYTIITDNACVESDWFADSDEDGYGDPENVISACDQPVGYVADNSDCDDTNDAVNPDAEEICDGLDNDCNGEIDEGLTFIDYYPDTDADGFGDENAVPLSLCEPPPFGFVANNGDCNDDSPLQYPGNPEVCDGIDNDCNGEIDDGIPFTDYYVDADEDGYGDAEGLPTSTCDGPPAGMVANNLDCNDDNDAINPDAEEICDGLDNDCNGEIDDGLTFIDYYPDTDGDTYGDENAVPLSLCGPPPFGFVANNGDCNDDSPLQYPGNPEVCDGIDNDCNGEIDDGIPFTDYYMDSDADGYGDAEGLPTSTCDGPPAGMVANNLDCNDDNDSINPDAEEICDGLDNDCNGEIDDGLTFIDYYPDLDEDGFGDENAVAVTTCDGAPANMVDNNLDCDDNDDTVYDGAPGTMSDIDNDCNGVIEGDEMAPEPCLGDFNFDGVVNAADLLVLLSEFGCDNMCTADLDDDDAVGASDILTFLSVFGTVCPQ